jgi:hypothetical protein
MLDHLVSFGRALTGPGHRPIQHVPDVAGLGERQGRVETIDAGGQTMPIPEAEPLDLSEQSHLVVEFGQGLGVGSFGKLQGTLEDPARVDADFLHQQQLAQLEPVPGVLGIRADRFLERRLGLQPILQVGPVLRGSPEQEETLLKVGRGEGVVDGRRLAHERDGRDGVPGLGRFDAAPVRIPGRPGLGCDARGRHAEQRGQEEDGRGAFHTIRAVVRPVHRVPRLPQRIPIVGPLGNLGAPVVRALTHTSASAWQFHDRRRVEPSFPAVVSRPRRPRPRLPAPMANGNFGR